jgi:hypothetical protein
VEALEVEDIGLEEMFFHLVKFIAANSVDITTLELLLEDLRHSNLTQVSAHAGEVPVHHEGILVILHLGWEICLILLLGREFLGGLREEVSIGLVAHVYILLFIL